MVIVNAYKEFIDLYLYHLHQTIVVTLVLNAWKLVPDPLESINADANPLSE